MGWTPIRSTTPPEAPPAGYLRISDKRGVHLVRKETPTLPAMPDLLPDDPTEAAYSMGCLLYTSPSPRDRTRSRMPSSA